MPPKARIAKRRTPVGSTAWNLPWSTSLAEASTPVDGSTECRAARLGLVDQVAADQQHPTRGVGVVAEEVAVHPGDDAGVQPCPDGVGERPAPHRRARGQRGCEADPRRGPRPHDVHDLARVLHLALVADAGRHLDHRRRLGRRQGLDRALPEGGSRPGGERHEGEGERAPHPGHPIMRPRRRPSRPGGAGCANWPTTARPSGRCAFGQVATERAANWPSATLTAWSSR